MDLGELMTANSFIVGKGLTCSRHTCKLLLVQWNYTEFIAEVSWHNTVHVYY